MKVMDYLIIGGVGYLILMMFKKPEPNIGEQAPAPTLGWSQWTPIESSRNDMNTSTYELQENTRTTKNSSGYSVRTYYRILKDGAVMVGGMNNRITDYSSAYNTYLGFLGVGYLSQQDLDNASPIAELGYLAGGGMSRATTPSSNTLGSRNSNRTMAWR